MFTVEVSCTVALPLRHVFAYVTDFRNAPAWQRQLAAVRLPDGPFPDGTRVVEIHRFLGIRVEAAGDLIAWDAPGTFTVRGRSTRRAVESRYSFSGDEEMADVGLRLTITPGGPARLAEPMLSRTLRADLASAFRRLPDAALDHARIQQPGSP
jgi:Polyketide cyclase / dehydrase and lipid transport